MVLLLLHLVLGSFWFVLFFFFFFLFLLLSFFSLTFILQPYGAFVVGIIAAIGGFFSVRFLKGKLMLDDVLDVTSLQGTPGIIGSILAGFFATTETGNSFVLSLLFIFVFVLGFIGLLFLFLIYFPSLVELDAFMVTAGWLPTKFWVSSWLPFGHSSGLLLS